MIHLGIDLATQPRSTGLCELREDDQGSLHAEFPARHGSVPTDDELLRRISSDDVRKVAIDVPFGWPTAFVDAVAMHNRERRWPDPGWDPDGQTRRLRYRVTDLWVVDHLAGLDPDGPAPRPPLSVSTDLLGVTAFRMARLERRLRDRGVPVDRSGWTGRLVEAYPAGTLRCWDLYPDTSYKSDRAVRERLVDALDAFLGGSVTGGWQEVCRDDNDELDAFVCALVARLAQRGRTIGPTSPAADDLDMATIQQEGWVHLPADPTW